MVSSPKEKRGNNPAAQAVQMDHSNLADRLELLEARLRMPAAPPQQQQQPQEHRQGSNNSLVAAALESPALSQHSFKFDTPSRSVSSNTAAASVNTTIPASADNSHSNISLLSTSSSKSKPSSSSTGRQRRGRSALDVVNLAAAQHMQKIAALEHNNNNSQLSTGVLSNASRQTLQTSHHRTTAADATLGSNTVVKETPNTAAVKADMSHQQHSDQNMTAGNPRALLAVTADHNTANKKGPNHNNDNTTTKDNNISTASGSKGARRKSTPVKRDVSALRSSSRTTKKSSNHTNTLNATTSSATNTADASRKRTRLQFSDDTHHASSNHSTPKLLSSPIPTTKTTSNSSNPSMKATAGSSRPHKTPKNNKLIRDFFTAVQKNNNNSSKGITATSSNHNSSRDSYTATITTTTAPPRTPPPTTTLSSTPSPYTEMAQLHRKCHQWEQLCQEKDAQLKAVSNNRTILQTAVQTALKQREEELAKTKETYTAYTAKVNVVVEDLMRKQALQDAQQLREQLASDGARLGRIVYTRAGMRSVESWEDGTASRHLQERRSTMIVQRSTLEERQKHAKGAVQAFVQQTQTTSDSSSSNNNNKENGPTNDNATSSKPQAAPKPVVEGITLETKLDALEALESVRLHLETVQRQLRELEEEEKRLQEEKVEHIRALKRLASEDASRFRNRPKVHDRYVLMSLLGKGGFSEVWRAFDVEDLQEVAVKIHQLDPRWSDDKKENYTKHVSREYEIHRNVRHPRIVSLLDVFEIDTGAFATVLECCKGTDLETILKRRSKLPEREARAILLQLLSGMNYLSHPSPDGSRLGIIHYDIKPGNILFDEHGDAKITDFGLSKIVETHDPGESMELTSQGAGTYWYLPPECFVMEEDVAVRISNKVDVWSIGVLYFQMIYGKRPFGHGLSQDRLLSDNTMLNAKEAIFPQEPTVSEMGKQFIRDCLQYDQALRPSIGQLCENAYVTTKKMV